MKRLVATALASVATLGLLSACGDSKSSSSTTVPRDTAVPAETVAPGDTAVSGDTILPSDAGGTIPEATIDLMIAQFEANGLKVDKACFTALLSDESMRKLVAASSGGTPSPEVIQKFISCMTP
jgi:ABC-type glycerol-3-phosphate transport system substrate-binding protein